MDALPTPPGSEEGSPQKSTALDTTLPKKPIRIQDDTRSIKSGRSNNSINSARKSSYF
jgi:hypothetical protein